MRQAIPVSDAPAGWPVRAVAGDLLEAWRGGGPQSWEAALDRADGLCRLLPARDSADDERRELLAGIVDELRVAPGREDGLLWAGMLAHLAVTPAPPATLY